MKTKSSNTTKNSNKTKQTLVFLPDYDTTFLKSSSMQAKGGKTVYIRPEHHIRMTRIINTIGQSKLSITDYLDNVLDNHFNLYKDDINHSFTENIKSII